MNLIGSMRRGGDASSSYRHSIIISEQRFTKALNLTAPECAPEELLSSKCKYIDRDHRPARTKQEFLCCLLPSTDDIMFSRPSDGTIFPITVTSISTLLVISVAGLPLMPLVWLPF